jgi:hypothetical protein
LTLLETFQFLGSCHCRAPFLFFNGNTFAEVGRSLATALFADLPLHRRKEASSAVAHSITGVLDEDLMVQAVESLCLAADVKPGDRVKTLRSSTPWSRRDQAHSVSRLVGGRATRPSRLACSL